MARAIFIFLVAALIAAFVVWVVSFPGWVTVDWFGYRYEAPMSVTTLILLGVITVLYFFLRLVRSIVGGPAAWQRYFKQRRDKRGMGALTEGLAAAAAGDAHLAHRQAARAGRLVKDGPLAQVLALEAAMLEERDGDVAALAPVLLNHPETELLGRRALFDLARKKHDRVGEVDHAEAAFGAHPAAGWAAETVLADAISAGDWERARSILGRAARHDAFPNGRADRIKAALLLAEAQDAMAKGDGGRAAGLARKAWDTDEGLVAAAVIRAELLLGAGKPKAAREVALKIWAHHPHPVPGRIFAEPGAEEAQDERLARVRELIALNPSHIETRLLAAEQAIAARNVVAAREALMPLLAQGGSARAFALMAALERTEHGAAAHPGDWMEKALAAPRDGVWECGTCGHRESEWHAVCPRCRAVATAVWATHRQEAEVVAAPQSVKVSDAPAAPAPKSSAAPMGAEPVPPPTPAAPDEAGTVPATDAMPEAGADLRQPDDPGPDEKPSPKEGREW